MTDVFISYASEDRDRAAELAHAFGTLGWSVWWDRKIIAGQAFDHAIERELEAAKSVVVLWSTHSIASEWVKNEAAFASERGVLVPAMIESVKLPLEFRRKQTADLTGWRGDPSHGGFQALCEGVAHTIGGTPPPQPIPARQEKTRRNPPWGVAAIAAVAVAAGLGIYLAGPWGTTTSPPVPHSDRPEVGTPLAVEKPPEVTAPPALERPREITTPPAVDRPPEVATPPADEKPPAAVAGLADLVIGTYFGDVIADSKGGSRSDIAVTITKLDRSTVRVSSDYHRLGTVDVTLTRIDNKILNADGDTPFMVDLDRDPPSVLFDPHSEIAYRGNRQP